MSIIEISDYIIFSTGEATSAEAEAFAKANATRWQRLRFALTPTTSQCQRQGFCAGRGYANANSTSLPTIELQLNIIMPPKAKAKTTVETTITTLRQNAEEQFAHELAELSQADNRQKPPNWKLSPWAVATYLLGGKLENGFELSPKYIGSRRLMEIAIATLATDRALLLYGVNRTYSCDSL